MRDSHSSFGGAPAPLFIAASYLPFLVFRGVVSRLQSAVSANMGLFCYRQVTRLPPLLLALCSSDGGCGGGLCPSAGATLVWFLMPSGGSLQVIIGYLLLMVFSIRCTAGRPT